MPGAGVERRLAAVLAADVVGYSRLMAADETGTHERLKAVRRQLIEPAVASHGGRIVKLMGDGLLITFASVVEAVECAAAIQQGLERLEPERPEAERIRLRIGINLGDIIVDEGDIYGDGVNIAARLEALAEPGGILISLSVHTHLSGKVAFSFEPLGAQRVKNIPEPVTVFRLAGRERRPLRIRHPKLTYAAAAVTFAVIIGGTLWWQGTGPVPATSSDKPAIAILPFDSLDPGEAYFAEGLTGDLITDLAQLSGLLVVGRSASFAYADTALDREQVAAELGVRYLLEGDIRRADDRLRINVQLIDTGTGDHLWAERFERQSADVFAVQDEVRRHIVDALSVRLSPAEAQRLERLPTANLEAYDYYLRAEHAARSAFRPRLREALQLYGRATTLDPSFALAFAADARTSAYVMRNNYDDIMPAPLARQRAYERASRALEIDPDASLPFAVLAVLQVVDGRHDEAIASAERAVALAPNDAEALSALGLVLTFAGRHEEAVVAIELAMRLDPRPPASDLLVAGLAYFLHDQPERAVEVLERARSETPNVDDVHAMLAAAYAATGQLDAAREAVAAALRLGVNLCVEVYRVIFSHVREQADIAKLLDALRLAGLPDWPFGFATEGLEGLTAAEIGPLVFDKVWQGEVEQGGPAIAQFATDGEMAFRTTTYFATGTAYVEGDQLCERVAANMLGRPICGPILRRSGGANGDALPYTYVNPGKVFHFAVAE